MGEALVADVEDLETIVRRVDGVEALAVRREGERPDVAAFEGEEARRLGPGGCGRHQGQKGDDEEDEGENKERTIRGTAMNVGLGSHRTTS